METTQNTPHTMEQLHEMLSQLATYGGDCLELDTLSWILRVGACAYQYDDLLVYLECELNKHCNDVEMSWVNDILEILRESELQISHKEYGHMDATTFRCHRLQLLVILLHEAVARSLGAVPRESAVLWSEQRKELKEALEAHGQVVQLPNGRSI